MVDKIELTFCSYFLWNAQLQVDALVALPGGYGTMEELLEMITWLVNTSKDLDLNSPNLSQRKKTLVV